MIDWIWLGLKSSPKKFTCIESTFQVCHLCVLIEKKMKLFLAIITVLLCAQACWAVDGEFLPDATDEEIMEVAEDVAKTLWKRAEAKLIDMMIQEKILPHPTSRPEKSRKKRKANQSSGRDNSSTLSPSSLLEKNARKKKIRAELENFVDTLASAPLLTRSYYEMFSNGGFLKLVEEMLDARRKTREELRSPPKRPPTYKGPTLKLWVPGQQHLSETALLLMRPHNRLFNQQGVYLLFFISPIKAEGQWAIKTWVIRKGDLMKSFQSVFSKYIGYSRQEDDPFTTIWRPCSLNRSQTENNSRNKSWRYCAMHHRLVYSHYKQWKAH